MNQTVTLGSTGITVNKNGFGALPIQRISTEEAVRLLQKAYKGGINFYDTARAYTDSEEKLRERLSRMSVNIFTLPQKPCPPPWRAFGNSCIPACGF